MSHASALALVLFSVWWIASLLYQSATSPVRRLPFGLRFFLGRWTFFAPNPGVHDFHLLVRDRLKGADEAQPWAEIGDTYGRRLLHALYHPDKRCRKLLIGVVKTMTAEQLDGVEDPRFVLSDGYLQLLSYVVSLPGPTAVEARQFMLLRSHPGQPDQEPDLLLRSEFHTLPC